MAENNTNDQSKGWLEKTIPSLGKTASKTGFQVPSYLEGTSNVTELNIRLWAATGAIQRVK